MIGATNEEAGSEPDTKRSDETASDNKPAGQTANDNRPADPSGSSRALSTLEPLIRSKSVLVCLGPGGVGKTTTAAALAIAGATLGLRVAVLTVDPARRLADAMGLKPAVEDIGKADASSAAQTASSTTQTEDPSDDHRSTLGSAALGKNTGLDNDATMIEGPWDGELWGVMLDPKATFDQLIDEHSKTTKQRDAILNNRLYQNLTTTLAGTNEYMAAERLRALHADDRFDLVVLDTPPAHHAIDLLDSPGRLSRFVDHPIYRTVLAPRPGVFKAMTSAANLVVRAIGQVVGSTLLADAIAFFNDFAGMDQGFRDRAAEIDHVLQSSETSYVLISSPRHEPLQAGKWIVEQLAERSRSIDALIVNRMTPAFWPSEDVEQLQDLDDPLAKNLVEMIKLRTTEESLVTKAMQEFGLSSSSPDPGRRSQNTSPAGSKQDSELVQVLIDEQPTPVSDVEALARLSQSLI